MMDGLRCSSVAKQDGEWPSDWYSFRQAAEVMLGRVRSKSEWIIFRMPDQAIHLAVLRKGR